MKRTTLCILSCDRSCSFVHPGAISVRAGDRLEAGTDPSTACLQTSTAEAH